MVNGLPKVAPELKFRLTLRLAGNVTLDQT
jgi:hypothetical protein